MPSTTQLTHFYLKLKQPVSYPLTRCHLLMELRRYDIRCIAPLQHRIHSSSSNIKPRVRPLSLHIPRDMLPAGIVQQPHLLSQLHQFLVSHSYINYGGNKSVPAWLWPAALSTVISIKNNASHSNGNQFSCKMCVVIYNLCVKLCS